MTKTAGLHAERDARAQQMGWTHVSDNGCPRRPVGKRCKTYSRRWPADQCWCENNLNDHSATWRHHPNIGGDKFVLWEPYAADPTILRWPASSRPAPTASTSTASPSRRTRNDPPTHHHHQPRHQPIPKANQC